MKLANTTRDSLQLVLVEYGAWARARTGPKNCLSYSYGMHYEKTADISNELAESIDKIVATSPYRKQFVLFYTWRKTPVYISAKVNKSVEQVLRNIELLENEIWEKLKSAYLL